MKQRFWFGTTLTAAALFCLSVPAHAQDYSAKYSGFQEVGGLGASETGAILSTGQATLKLSVDKNAKTLKYTLTYSGLTNVLQAHIHFGKEHVAGGVMVFFCTNLANGPVGTPSCPDTEGTVSGTVTATGVVGPTAQNISAGDFEAVVAALASNTVYGNIHTKQFPAGEIRGQVHAVGPDKDHDQSGNQDKDDDH